MPDILFGNPYPLGGNAQLWFANHPVSKTKASVSGFLQYIKRNFKNVKFVAGIGYCFGAKYFANHLTETGINDVGVFAHPSLIKESELRAIKKPLMISAAEIDRTFTDELRYKSEDILRTLSIPYQIDLFGNVSHGFAVRSDLSDKRVKYAAEKAFADAIYWIQYHATK